MLAAEIGAGVGELVSLGRSDGPGGDGGVSRPAGVVGVNGLVEDVDVGVAWDSPGVLGDFGGAVVVVIEGVGDVRAVDVVELDLKAVANVAGVIDGVEVVDGAVGNAGGLSRAARQ